jgi:hypothetical protein
VSAGRRGPLAATDVTRTWEVAAELERILGRGYHLSHTHRMGWLLRQFDSKLGQDGEPRMGWTEVDQAPEGQLGALLVRHQEQRRGRVGGI